MALKKYKPTSPGRRFMTTSGFEEITRSGEEKSLLEPLTKKGGRNNRGRITTRHQGGGHKRRISGRSTSSGRRTGCRPGWRRSSTTRTGRPASRCCTTPTGRSPTSCARAAARRRGARSPANADIKPGNALPLANIPTGTLVHAVELKPGQGARMARSPVPRSSSRRTGTTACCSSPRASCAASLLACRATVGQVGNSDHANQSGGKAGRSRWLGKRPTVRGSAMNPVDHPHGGGEGKTKGRRHPVTPVGQSPRSGSARRKHKESDKLIVRGRRRGWKEALVDVTLFEGAVRRRTGC